MLCNLCPYERLTKQPNDTDRSTDANIYRVIKVRNSIQHAPTPVADDIYQSIVKDAEKPLEELGCPLSEIQRDVYNVPFMDEKTKTKIGNINWESQY